MPSSSKTGPSRLWFIVPSVLLLAALTLGGIGIVSFVKFVNSDFRPYQPDSSISVTADGFTLYAERGTPGLDDLHCAAIGARGGIELRPTIGRITLSNGHGTFFAVASTPKDIPPGRYRIACETGFASDEQIPLYLGARSDLAEVGRLAVLGVVAPLFLGFCSVALFALLPFLRYRASRTKPVAG